MTFYIEIKKKNGRVESFSYRCESHGQALTYANSKQAMYPGSRIITCRPFKGSLGRDG
jgi:hypothetical protein